MDPPLNTNGNANNGLAVRGRGTRDQSSHAFLLNPRAISPISTPLKYRTQNRILGYLTHLLGLLSVVANLSFESYGAGFAKSSVSTKPDHGSGISDTQQFENDMLRGNRDMRINMTLH